MMQDEPPAEAAEPKPKRVKKDLPTGILYNATKNKYQARIKGDNGKGKCVQIDRPIPGLYATSTAAVEAQAEAQRKWDAGQAVWAAPPADRNARGQVCQPLSCALTVSFTISRRRAFVRDQSGLLDGQTARRSGTPAHRCRRRAQALAVATTRTATATRGARQQCRRATSARRCHCRVMRRIRDACPQRDE